MDPVKPIGWVVRCKASGKVARSRLYRSRAYALAAFRFYDKDDEFTLSRFDVFPVFAQEPN